VILKGREGRKELFYRIFVPVILDSKDINSIQIKSFLGMKQGINEIL